MITARREAINNVLAELQRGQDENVLFSVHPGLALHRLLEKRPSSGEREKKPDSGRHPYVELLQSISKWRVGEEYRVAYRRWRDALDKMQALALFARAATPLAIGLGIATPLENGLTIHHTYGTPYLPGSALKGVARRAADALGLAPTEVETVFGNKDSAGHIVFWDGWFDPADGEGRPYQLDVLTPHHPKYYGTRGEKWPTDFDDPNPVHFLSIRPKTTFFVAVSSYSEGATPWLELARYLVQWGLEHIGLGAKTNAGYGYFSCEIQLSKAERVAYEDKVRRLLEDVVPQIERITNPGALSLVDKIMLRIRGEGPGVQKEILQRLRAQMEKYELWKDGEPRAQRIEKMMEELL